MGQDHIYSVTKKSMIKSYNLISIKKICFSFTKSIKIIKLLNTNSKSRLKQLLKKNNYIKRFPSLLIKRYTQAIV